MGWGAHLILVDVVQLRPDVVPGVHYVLAQQVLRDGPLSLRKRSIVSRCRCRPGIGEYKKNGAASERSIYVPYSRIHFNVFRLTPTKSKSIYVLVPRLAVETR